MITFLFIYTWMTQKIIVTQTKKEGTKMNAVYLS